MDRPTWDSYFMNMAKLVSKRSTCLRRKVGAVLVNNHRILATGYNGAPTGLKHCEDVGCIRQKNNVPSGEKHELCRAVHAEQNAIIQCAYHGVSSKDSILYVTCFPCTICAKMLINAGVKRICYESDYTDSYALKILHESKIILQRLGDTTKS